MSSGAAATASRFDHDAAEVVRRRGLALELQRLAEDGLLEGLGGSQVLDEQREGVKAGDL
jgi:hypothetical protein